MPYCTKCGRREYYCPICGELITCDCDLEINSNITTGLNYLLKNNKKHVCANNNIIGLNANKYWGLNSRNDTEFCTLCGELMPEIEFCPDYGQDITPKHNCKEEPYYKRSFNMPHICSKRKLW